MKKFITFLSFWCLSSILVFADVVIDGKTYSVDTIVHRQVGPGMMHSILRLPSYPMNVYIMEMDNTNPDNRVETTFSRGRLGQLEFIDEAMVRNRTATKRPIAACNANFWVVSTTQPAAQFMLNYPWGGVIRNDTVIVNSSTNADIWGGGPGNTGATAVDVDGKIHAGRWMWNLTVRSPKVQDGAPQNIASVNRRAIRGEMALFNEAYGLTRVFENRWVSYNEKGENESLNLFLRLKEGESWAVGKDMVFEVVRITVRDGSALGANNDYDACLTCTGNSKDLMAPIERNDELIINIGVSTNDPGSPHITPQIESLVEGNATVMYRGELTERNFNESYNSQVYSRTAYGTNAEGTHLYMIVIDKSLSPIYGRSAGATTAQMCQLLKCLIPDVYNVVNYDAGGSALMYVDGDYVNTSTENNARRVSCGWMMEAVGEEDNEIASIGFADYHVKMPIYSSYTPVIWGYNARGEIVDHDVKGFTLSCDETIGTTNREVFTASSNPIHGTIMATFNGMTATLKVTTFEAWPAIKLKPTIVVDDRPYPIEVVAEVDGGTYQYNPSLLGWSVYDNEVAQVKNGVLYGMNNGTTQLHCQIGDLFDETEVSVEISDTSYIYEPWTDWSLKASGHKNLSLTEDGTLAYTYGNSRVAYMSLNKNVRFFGLPDEIGFTFTSDVPVEKVLIDLRNYEFSKSNIMTFAPDSGYFSAGEEHRIVFDLEAMGGVQSVSTYPLTLHYIRFEMEKGLEAADHTIQLSNVYAHYKTMSNVLGDLDGNGLVDVEDINIMVNIVLKLDDNPRMIQLGDLDGNGLVDVEDVNAMINIILRLD